jgi:hypothetical protein
MHKNNWAYAVAAASGDDNRAAADRGDACLVFWERGLGLAGDGATLPAWRAQKDLPPRRPASVAAELGAWYTLSGED